MWNQLIEKCDAAFQGDAKQETAGIELARAISRPRPFSASTMSRFWNQQKLGEPLLRALCAYFDFPYPIIRPPLPDLARWYDLGERLYLADKDEFRELLKSAGRRLELAELRAKFPRGS